MDESEFLALVEPMYQSENVSLLRKLYESSVVDCHDMDPIKYSFSKKFSEVSTTWALLQDCFDD